MMDTATATAPTARPTMGIAMVAGTTGRAISTAVNLAATRGTEVCKQHKIYIAYTKNTGPAFVKPVPSVCRKSLLRADFLAYMV